MFCTVSLPGHDIHVFPREYLCTSWFSFILRLHIPADIPYKTFTCFRQSPFLSLFLGPLVPAVFSQLLCRTRFPSDSIVLLALPASLPTSSGRCSSSILGQVTLDIPQRGRLLLLRPPLARNGAPDVAEEECLSHFFFFLALTHTLCLITFITFFFALCMP